MLSRGGVVLRPITLEDTENIIKWRNSDSVRRNFIYQDLFTKESQEKWFHTMIETDKARQFIIYNKLSNNPIGTSYLRDIDRVNRKAEYGIFIGTEDDRGKGLGAETAELMIAYGFEVMGLHKIFLRVFSDNIRAQKSYERAGFRQEAYLKEEVFVDGIFKDIILMAKINDED